MAERYDKLLDGEDGSVRDIVEIMRRESAYWLSQAASSFENGDFELEEQKTLEELEQRVRDLGFEIMLTEQGYLFMAEFYTDEVSVGGYREALLDLIQEYSK